MSCAWRSLAAALALGGLLCLLPAAPAAGAEIEISAPGQQAIPLALTRFLPQEGGAVPAVAEELEAVLAADLDLAGLFRFLDRQVFLDDAGKVGLFSTQVDFGQWQLLGAEVLIKGAYRVEGDQLAVEARLFDVPNRRLLTGRRFIGRPADVRRIAHAFADDILKTLTGEAGPFDARLAYISTRSGHKELWLMDVDGGNPLRLTDHRSIVLNPDFSPTGKELLFTSYRAGNPDLYRKEVFTGREVRLSSQPGLNIAGRYAPDGGGLALTLSRDGDPDLYLLGMNGAIRQRLTNSFGIDVDPSWSPDGRQLAFVSSRLGSPQIFILDAASGASRRLTANGRYDATPAWSPKGDRIVFARQEGNRFDLYSIRPDGTDERRLTFGPGSAEHPRWSPDGRFLVYSLERGGKKALWIMRADGTGGRQVAAEGSHPAWSVVW
ncbi:MAG: Tol-Pal system beta propeller repeat protein TolB [Deltaproteobacteria bacterium]|nr:MAG: Tol-Pal system beta propeller repeat protein TolB [Deltaproteobacteria bacterium]